MKPPPFVYHRARSAEDAVDALARFGDDAKVLAGGQSLVAMMNLRLARPSALVDISAVPGLRYVLAEGSSLRIGALTTHAQIEEYPILLDGLDVLQRAARWVGHYPVRTQGTFGGSIAHADPAAEWCLLAVLFDAEIVALGRSGQRRIPAKEFFRGFLTTALEPDELLVETRFPSGADHSSLTEFARRHGDFAIVAAGVAFDVDDGRCRNVRIALAGVADRPVRIEEAEGVLEGEQPDKEAFREVAQMASGSIDPPADIHATTEYRKYLAAGLIERALIEAYDDGSTEGDDGG